MDIVTQGLTFFYFLFLHFFRMMYWVWVPGFFFSAFFALRYRESARSRLLFGGGLFAALLYGITSSPSRKKALGIAGELKQKGVGTAKILAYLIASQNLVVYFLVILMAMLGAEFALGQLLGGVIMALLVAGGWRLLTGEKDSWPAAVSSDGPSSQVTWRGLLFSGSGWWEAVRYVGKEFRFFLLNFLLGLLFGGVILSAGLKSWWPDLSGASQSIFRDLLYTFAAPLLAVLLYVPPVGNIPIVSNLFKAYTFTYPGVVSFLLASLLNPLILPGYFQLFGKKRAVILTVLLYFAAAFSGVLVTGIYGLVGFRPGHVPLGRNLVDEIIKWLPFTMGKMGGMEM